ncbi:MULTISPECIES: hypothetical protein [unclassified Rhizobium]|uniref:hypothetical protein n=1 Tax=unclassified Rhizobium TaxID=2613769 RepID=UPI001AD9AFA4|nr:MULTISPECIES: hypothetical protein [unclassified Rhizobium]MBO9100342.1 hypothetical protein [Rhizobium sp. L58/93]MBO9186235.1 hypothetical protein [Rhizobium sp. E27B/91]QXZ83153.1 hypothetical protein J5287_13875 [Rhizobium sp. K1/93]QXZ89335.1 hypothetical protein J5280_14715 [Rhizobium sp. K15/93]QYA01923.1 hypothetical protein J5278_01655 [Rhizobium sp. B21/90]
MSDKPWPILMKPTDIVGMKRAEQLSGRDARTVKRWCLDYRIGHQSTPNAPWEISGPALVMIRHGDFDALELLRAGDRACPQVTRIFDFTGFEP